MTVKLRVMAAQEPAGPQSSGGLDEEVYLNTKERYSLINCIRIFHNCCTKNYGQVSRFKYPGGNRYTYFPKENAKSRLKIFCGHYLAQNGHKAMN